MLDGPLAWEVDGLRRVLGDTSLGRVPAHITLVPPVNVSEAELADALGVLRRSARLLKGPLALTFGPGATFWPESPVGYLEVNGPAEVTGELRRLHDALLSGPLHRPERWPWVPHVTVADELSPEAVAVVVAATAGYRAEAVLDRVVLLEEQGRTWSPLADARLGPATVVGRGGLQLELVEGRCAGPDVLQLFGDVALPAPEVVLSCFREAALVGAALAWAPRRPGSPLEVAVMVSPGSRRQGVGRALLNALRPSLERQGWSPDGALAHGPAGFYEQVSAWALPVEGPVI